MALIHRKLRSKQDKINAKHRVYQEIRNDLFVFQNGRCAICDAVLKRREACLDHHHTGDYYRGVLCRNCNTGIGMFKDDTRLLSRAAIYVAFYHRYGQFQEQGEL